MQNCIRFLYGTKMSLSRPGGPATNQRACYSGHKRAHYLNFLKVRTPYGLVLYMNGPEEGRMHDITLFRMSVLDSAMEKSLLIGDIQYYAFGDPAFIMRPWIQVGFVSSNSETLGKEFNRAMSSAREAVEWSYKYSKQQLTSNDFPGILKSLKDPISLMYKATAVLCNLKVCLTSK